jgi:hypothetical protein
MRTPMMHVGLVVAGLVLGAAAPGMAQTTAAKVLTPQQQKLRDCGAEWQRMKQEGRTNGLTWAELRRECLRRK